MIIYCLFYLCRPFCVREWIINQPIILQALKIALAQIRICSRLEALLLKKKNLSNGDSPEVHAQKVYFFPLLVSLGR